MSEETLPGRLARVIATRGGLAPPEAPFVIEHREALIYMLCEAAELEHGIMCQYLFAAFSMKDRADEGLTDEQAETVRRWRKQISPRRRPGDAAPGARAEPAVRDRRRPAPVPAELPAARQPLSGRGAPGAAAVRRGGAAPLHVPRAPRGHGAARRTTGSPPSSRAAPRDAARRHRRRAARTSRPSATCTGRSRPASPTWRKSTASGGCSSARRAPRPPGSTSAGRSWSR